MNLISISGALKELGDKLLYQDISFGIDEGEKIALIGVNGSGKSTLMKIIVGLEQFDKGTMAQNKNLVIGYLGQEVSFKPGQTLRDFLFDSDNPRIKTLREYLAVQEKINETQDGPHDEDKESSQNQKSANENNEAALLNQAETLSEKMTELDAWKLESEAREILSHLGLPAMDVSMESLSGGMARKAELARLLVGESNLLLLDEPTNHLDIDSIDWLENYLIKIKKAVVMITHDRYFLDNVADFILEIDHQNIAKFRANYSLYLLKKAEIAEIEKRTLEKHNNILTRELSWLSRMPKARGTKQKARIGLIEERLEAVKALAPQKEMGNFYSGQERLGKKILEALNISKSFGDELIFPSFSHEFCKGERIGIIGGNGAGKTTFLKILMLQLSSDSGKVNHGVNTRIGYLTQTPLPVKEELTLIDAVCEIANYIELEDGKKIRASELLERFLFTGHKQRQKVHRLSGGERRRLDIIRLLMANPNFLILDEPTNDLDLQTLSILEDYLADFTGCLVVVSHDRYFLDKLASSLLIFQKGRRVEKSVQSVSDYLSSHSAGQKSSKKSASVIKKEQDGKGQISTEKSSLAQTSEDGARIAKKENRGAPKKKKLSYKHERRKAEIEKDIPPLEKEVATLEASLSGGESDPEKLAGWGKEHTQKEELLFELLSELAEIEATLE